MAKYFNTALSFAMLPDGNMTAKTLTAEEAAKWLNAGHENVANPNHWNTLRVVSGKLGVEVEETAQGGRISLQAGDEVLVAQITGLPFLRETREYTDEEVANATYQFRLLKVLD